MYTNFNLECGSGLCLPAEMGSNISDLSVVPGATTVHPVFSFKKAKLFSVQNLQGSILVWTEAETFGDSFVS